MFLHAICQATGYSKSSGFSPFPLGLARMSPPPILMAWPRLLLAASALAAAFAPGAVRAAGTNEILFNRDIRPILSENCALCHGQDKNRRKAKLRLDVREVALDLKAIVPFKPDESLLVQHIFATKEDELMPPPQTHKVLTAAQKDLLKRWIAAGAEYQPHWSYIKPERPPLPLVRKAGWVRNPIDAFILSGLETKGLAPSREADKATLLRRLSLDLIGLPPTQAELTAFLNDSSAKAYERQVDRLLNSPHFGERMAAPWLDLVRFADTVGYHGDQNINVFPYRDYVINAFNQNKPFDQFTIEQLAGDLLPNPTVEQRVATGFNRLNMVTREGGAQPGEYLAKYAADRVRTVSMTWLGSTMGCCECHDHKYDPFWTKDFYSMEAFFADLKQWGVYQDYGYTPNPDLKGWSNDHPFPPEIEVESPYLERRITGLRRHLAELLQKAARKCDDDPKARTAYSQWQGNARAFMRENPDGWLIPQPEITLSSKDTNAPPKATAIVDLENKILIKGEPGDIIRVGLPLSEGTVGAVRLELIPDASHDGSIIRGGGENTYLHLSAHLKHQNGQSDTRLSFYYAEGNFRDERYSNGYTILGVQDGWLTSKSQRRSPHTGIWLLDKPVDVHVGDTLVVSLGQSSLGCLRLAVSPFVAIEPLEPNFMSRLNRALTAPSLLRSKDDRSLLAATYLFSAPWDAEALGNCRQFENQIRECRGGRSPTVVAEAREPLITRVLPRGNWQDQSGEIVQPAAPHFLPQIPNPTGRRLTRLDLAKWVVSRDNPLTARTVVNRLWKQFYGTALSAVVDDLGTQGEWPTHPELLDWLAVEFMDQHWDIKHIVKLVVMSATYRQDSHLRRDLEELDPNNRLLASQSPRRLEAEFVRDNALFVAGLLNLDLGGPSAHPYQPSGYYANLQFPDRDYDAETDQRQYRRGLYTHWQRAFLHPMLANFDAPSREECTAYRTVSNTPQQALTLLNDPSFVEAARTLAARILSVPRRSDEQRLDDLFRTTLMRPIKAKERASLQPFLATQREHYNANAQEAEQLLRVGNSTAPTRLPAGELAAWTTVCRVVLNLHETITRY